MLSPGFRHLASVTVKPEWIDHNGHMNVAYYVLAFDEALTDFIYEIGINPEYRKTMQKTVFVLETHVCYIQEVHEGAPIDISIRVLDYDNKRLHLFLEMYHAEDGFLSATSEQMILSVDRTGPKATDFPPATLEDVDRYYTDQKSHDWPVQAKASIAIRRK